MSLSRPPRVLIATASFGDGHNTAARGLAKALEGQAECLLIDPCAEASPRFNSLVLNSYRFVTTYLPGIWKRIYDGVERRDFSRQNLPFERKIENAFALQLTEFNPDVIVSTFPLFPYFVARYIKGGGRRRPMVTIVTDSMEINASWRKAPTDFWLVTDGETKNSLVEQKLPAEKIIETGFPVDPIFDTLQPIPATDRARPFRVLYFPTASKRALVPAARAILEHEDWPVELTIVLGRNLRRLYRRARELVATYPNRVRLKGWSHRVPELLCEHHLVVGKAGGATVHESLAACCPMLIQHLVPGQEEGNLKLLQRIGGGSLAETETALAAALRDLLSDQASHWRRQKQHLTLHSRPQASKVAASFVLELATKVQSSPVDD
ncbi:MAG: hypothetical protein MK194_05230 [Roseibacillus sp.]|nr:hypothetical protein [Roseibacillus sp.]